MLFIPGNAGSYKQIRSIAAEAAHHYHDVLQNDRAASAKGVRNLDFFTVDFNEDITAFHGQTLLDQAEYLNEAIRYILSLYMDPRLSARPSDLPDPTSVMILGHSMGGVVARTMLIMPNYQINSINTILTMSAPHALPPVTFDGQIVKIYDDINDYWRKAYAEKWANNNPLWHVTLVSIAGGGLDTVVPSDYASVESILPETHGFTVFTTGIPTVWTSMDHQNILWCDQFRKVVARAMYDVVDAHRPSQTKPRAERMRAFKKWFLTGMEAVAEKGLPHQEPTIPLILDDKSNTVVPHGERLLVRGLGREAKTKTYLLPVPPQGSPHSTRFTLLSNVPLDHDGGAGKLEVLFCSVSLLPGQAASMFETDMDISAESNASTRLVCKNAAPDLITLPPSTHASAYPFPSKNERTPPPFSYLQFDLDDISEHQFVAILDKTPRPTNGFVLAEFADHSKSHRTLDMSLYKLLTLGVTLRLPANRPTVAEFKIPAMESSLLAYHMDIGYKGCGKDGELFAPLVRQFLNRPYESKFFVNARHADISLHGISPFVPPPLVAPTATEKGVGFQIWADPTCESPMTIRIQVDALGSLGKLYIRYRTVFAAFPLLIVAMVLRKQFQAHDQTGAFVSFTDGLNKTLRRSFPLLLLSLTLLSMTGGDDGQMSGSAGAARAWDQRNGTFDMDFSQNDSVIGTQDPFFWFLVPVIGVVSVGVCVSLHYVTILLTQIISVSYGFPYLMYLSVTRIVGGRTRDERPLDKRRALSPPTFVPSSPERRMITTAVLLFLVSTFIPYQFAYLVACLVQLFTTVRALRIAQDLGQTANANFYHYAHSILLLMLWVLPINLPILAVWIRNLAVHWLTPFSSHHNVLSIVWFILLVENLTTGKMIPRLTSPMRHVTGLLLMGIAFYAGVYGISYAYRLHHLVHIATAWLVLIHLTSGSWSLAGLRAIFEGGVLENRKRAKAP